MDIIYARRCGASLGTAKYVIHSLFESSLNLVSNNEQPLTSRSASPLLITIRFGECDMQRHLIVLEKDDFFKIKQNIERIKPQHYAQYSVQTQAHSILCTHFHINCSAAQPWQAQALQAQQLTPQQLAQIINLLNQRKTAITAPLWHHAYQQISCCFERYLSDGNAPQFMAILGLGMGLTPSGDDFMMGYLAALHARSGSIAIDLAQAINAASPSATTLISQHFLNEALAGAFSASLIALNQLSPASSAPSITTCLMQVLDKGSTSGLDLALGYFSGLLGYSV